MSSSVSFCNGTAFKIDNAGLKEKIFLECERLFDHKLKRDYFPGPQPVAVEKKDLTVLKKNKYVVCEKSDGERYVMILINIDNKPMGFIINRNNEIYFLSMSFKKEVFEGSVFDGELIKTKNTGLQGNTSKTESNAGLQGNTSKTESNAGLQGNTSTWNYLIHDCMSYNGKSFIKQNHDLRYAAILDFITKRYVPKETDCFYIKTKLFYNYGPEIAKTWEHIKETTENEIDGLIFTPVNEPFTFGRQYSLLKWKNNHTIDLLVKKTGKKINLYGVRKGINFIFKTITDEKNCALIIDFCKPDQLKTGIIIEFNYIPEGDLFKPYRLRLDKELPNGELTINNTLKNIEESISIDEL